MIILFKILLVIMAIFFSATEYFVLKQYRTFIKSGESDNLNLISKFIILVIVISSVLFFIGLLTLIGTLLFKTITII